MRQNRMNHPVLSNMSNEERPRQMASKHNPHDKINISGKGRIISQDNPSLTKLIATPGIVAERWRHQMASWPTPQHKTM